MSPQRSEEVMRTYLAEVVGKRRYELIPQLAAEDMIDHTQPVKGRQGLVNHVQNFHRTFPDVTIQIKRIVAGENDASTGIGVLGLQGTGTAGRTRAAARRSRRCSRPSVSVKLSSPTPTESHEPAQMPQPARPA